MAETDQEVAGNPDTAYEPSDWPVLPIGWLFAAILVFLALAVGTMIWAYPDSLGDVDRRPAVEPPEPRLQIDPAADLMKFRADKERRLNSYYWIDQQRNLVHIPIEKAMEKVVKDGIDGFPKGRP